MNYRPALTALLLTLASCTQPQPPVHPAPPARAAVHPVSEPSRAVISIVGTSDLHGHVEHLSLFAGYLENIRRKLELDGASAPASDRASTGVLLVDAGDMFTGTLVSNLTEGAAVIRAYNALGYQAATVGNHEFDFGPVGPAVVPSSPGDDARGALRARAKEAHFPILAANVLDAQTGQSPGWENMPASTQVDVAGVPIGIIGVSTDGALRETLRANAVGLEMAPLAETIATEAKKLRDGGAAVVVVAAHAGGSCTSFSNPDDLSTCEPGELFTVAEALPKGTVDVIVGGHTHQGIAHRVNGIAVIESYFYGRAFGRVDLVVDRREKKVLEARIHPPQNICAGNSQTECQPSDYEGAPVHPVAAVEEAIAGDLAKVRAVQAKSLGVTVATAFTHAKFEEDALGNLLADLMLRARPGADVAIMNGGAIRTGLASGPLTYGAFFEMFPFDSRFATAKVHAQFVKEALAANLQSRRDDVLLIAGLRAVATCAGDHLRVDLYRVGSKRPIRDNEPLVVLTNDYVAGQRFGLDGSQASPFEVETGDPMREALTAVLRREGGSLRGDDPTLLDPKKPRIAFPGKRPVVCGVSK